jgi:hypothetical protein
MAFDAGQFLTIDLGISQEEGSLTILDLLVIF